MANICHIYEYYMCKYRIACMLKMCCIYVTYILHIPVLYVLVSVIPNPNPYPNPSPAFIFKKLGLWHHHNINSTD